MNDIVRKGVIIVCLMTVMMASRAQTLGVAAANVPVIDPTSIVPEQFRDNAAWSQEKGWHWVTLSYDGTQRFTGSDFDYSLGKPLPAATYVATLVRTLPATDSCADCVKISQNEEGPPAVMGGASNPALSTAYAHLDNGPRKVINAGNPSAQRWTKGSWYLNYSPTTRTFFSWTWIPDDGGFHGVKTEAELSTTVTSSFASLGGLNLSQSVTPGSRVFPIAGGYVVSQAYGCVSLNAGYPSPTFCPSDRPSFHDGVDLAATAGTPIIAAASGTVSFAGIDPSTASGNSMIVIDLDGSNAGYETVYMHWEKSFVKTGDHVSAGQVIADVGSVGYSTGPHLHFSVRIGATNQTIDPLAWLTGSIQFATTNAQAGLAYAGVMQWQSLIQQAANAYNVPSGLIAAIMAVESGGNPNAVSPAGALGLMQVMPDQLTRLGVTQDKWTDPASNIDAAARYLAETLGSGGTIQDSVARYFGSGCDALGTCTQDYVNRVLTLYVYFANWIESGTAPTLTNPAPVLSTQVSTTTTVSASTNGNSTNSTPPPAPPTTPSPTQTPTDSPTATPSPTTSAEAATPTPSPSATAGSTPAASTTPSASPTSTPSPTPEPTGTPAATPSATPAASETPAATPSATPAASETPVSTQSATPTSTVEPTATATPSPAPTKTPGDSNGGSTYNGVSNLPTGPLLGPTLNELLPGGSSPTPSSTSTP